VLSPPDLTHTCLARPACRRAARISQCLSSRSRDRYILRWLFSIRCLGPAPRHEPVLSSYRGTATPTHVLQNAASKPPVLHNTGPSARIATLWIIRLGAAITLGPQMGSCLADIGTAERNSCHCYVGEDWPGGSTGTFRTTLGSCQARRSLIIGPARIMFDASAQPHDPCPLAHWPEERSKTWVTSQSKFTPLPVQRSIQIIKLTYFS
jgi:hypothetical protein